MDKNNFNKLIKILLIPFLSLLISMSATADQFSIEKQVVQMDIELLKKMNDEAYALLPLAELILPADGLEAQKLISKLLQEKMKVLSYKKQVENLRDELASFLASGGILISKTDSDEQNLEVFNKIGHIQPLIFLLTRAIVFESGGHFVENGYGQTTGKIFRFLVAMVPFAGFGLAIKADESLKEHTSENESKYKIIQACSLATMSDETLPDNHICKQKDTVKLISVFRKFTGGALLLFTLDRLQQNRSESDFKFTTLEISGSQNTNSDDYNYFEQFNDFNGKCIDRMFWPEPGSQLLLRLRYNQ